MMNAQLQNGWWRRREAPAAANETPVVVPDDGKLPFRALMAFTFILIIAPQTLFPALASMRIALIAAALAAVSFLYNRFVRRRPLVEFSRETVLVACLLAWSILTLPLSYWPGGSVSHLVNTFAKTLIIFWLLSHVVNTLPRLRFAAWGLSLMALPLALSAVANLAEGKFLTQSERIIGYDAPLTGNPNDLALTLNLILPLSIGLFLSGVGKPWIRKLLVAGIFLSVIGVFATYSRGGFLTLAVIVGLYVWSWLRRPRERHLAFLTLFLVLAMIPFLPEGYVERLSTITDIESDASGSAQERWGDTLAAIEYVIFHPVVGAGVGMDILALNEVRGPAWKEVHNVYLQYAVDLGLPGLILFVMLLRGVIRNARYAQYSRWRGRPDAGGLFHLAEGIRISLIAFSVAAFFHPVGYHFYFYYFAGLAIAVKTIATAGQQKPADAATPIRRFS
jgi:probable O-glycosylation ligase (exosortase A-associated)